MKADDSFIETPWDSRGIGVPTFEIKSVSEELLKKVSGMFGHFTVKIHPLSPKNLLHEHGFYYCDTLVEPFCTPEKFRSFENPETCISRNASLKELIPILHHAFIFGRFHRDFNVDVGHAELRYIMWLKDLYNSGNIFALMYRDKLAGFLGYDQNKIVLHALSKHYRGKGLSKYLWTVACQELFRGHREIFSSISVGNLAILNLYSSLGFGFRNPLDVYHKFNKQV